MRHPLARPFARPLARRHILPPRAALRLITLLTLAALGACDPGATDGPDMAPSRCAAYCDQQAACDRETRAACEARCDELADDCLTCGANSSCGNLESGACADECGERDGGVGEDIGQPCTLNTQCSTGWCRAPDGMASPVCARDDLGEPCTMPADCAHGVCLVPDGEAQGTCAATCEDFSDCPSFSTCRAEDGGALYCRREQ